MTLRQKAEEEAEKFRGFIENAEEGYPPEFLTVEGEAKFIKSIADTLEPLYQRIEELKEKNQELTQALDTAHKIFGSESDKFGEMISKLEAKLEKAVEAFKKVGGYNNGCGCCSNESAMDNEKVKEILKEIEDEK